MSACADMEPLSRILTKLVLLGQCRATFTWLPAPPFGSVETSACASLTGPHRRTMVPLGGGYPKTGRRRATLRGPPGKRGGGRTPEKYIRSHSNVIAHVSQQLGLPGQPYFAQ